MPRPRLRAVFFDAAGTLIHLRGSVGSVYAAAAASFGLRADAAVLDACFRSAFRRAPPMAFPGVGAADLGEHEKAWWKGIVREAFAAYEFPALDEYFEDLYARFSGPEWWEVYADVVPTLSRLKKRRLITGVISNFDSRLLPLSRALGLDRLLDSFTLSSRVGFAKPDRRIFEAALRRHGLRPAEAVHVGDSSAEDVAGAEAAGLRALLVRSDDRSAFRELLALAEG